MDFTFVALPSPLTPCLDCTALFTTPSNLGRHRASNCGTRAEFNQYTRKCHFCGGPRGGFFRDVGTMCDHALTKPCRDHIKVLRDMNDPNLLLDLLPPTLESWALIRDTYPGCDYQFGRDRLHDRRKFQLLHELPECQRQGTTGQKFKVYPATAAARAVSLVVPKKTTSTSKHALSSAKKESGMADAEEVGRVLAMPDLVLATTSAKTEPADSCMPLTGHAESDTVQKRRTQDEPAVHQGAPSPSTYQCAPPS